MARPTKRNRGLILVLAGTLGAGATRAEACGAVGIHRGTLRRWLLHDGLLRRIVSSSEEQGADLRGYRLWLRHPFRGKRPPGDKYNPAAGKRYRVLRRG